ncbi:hypothetical protein, partial [Synechococcus sp. RC10A2]|uniref:hypothetical protein n=1 Tax=Synechococcus sp. RC10A2 TaxID=2964529 RepID=UPI0039C65A09
MACFPCFLSVGRRSGRADGCLRLFLKGSSHGCHAHANSDPHTNTEAAGHAVSGTSRHADAAPARRAAAK